MNSRFRINQVSCWGPGGESPVIGDVIGRWRQTELLEDAFLLPGTDWFLTRRPANGVNHHAFGPLNFFWTRGPLL